MAKDFLQRYVRTYIGSVDLSGDARTYGSLMSDHEQVPLWSLNSPVRYFTVGQAQFGIDGYQALMNDTATTGSHQVLKSANNSTQVSVLMGSGGEPAIGDPAYSLPGLQMTEENSFDTGAASILASWMPDGSQSIAAVAKAWGKVIHPATSLSATTNGTSVDNGASSANGGHAIIHITVSSGGTWVLKVQDSPDDAAWSDLITFTADGSAVTSELGTVSGTVDRYVRFQATRTSGSLTPICTFVRY